MHRPALFVVLLLCIFSTEAAETAASKSVATGSGLLTATAGISASFTITARDESGVDNPVAGDWFVAELSGTRSLLGSVANLLSGLHQVTYTATKSGSYEAHVKLAKSGGLTGSYYENVWFFYSPVQVVVDPQINIDWGTGLITPTGQDYISVRWQGKVKTQYAEVYDFFATTDDGARLYVDNTPLIDRWDSFCDETRGTISLQANKLYDIKMEYKEVTGTAFAKLSWRSPSTPKEIIPSSQLYYENHIKSSPFKFTVQPNVACGSTCTAAGSGLSTATAGSAATLTIQANDEYGNARGPGSTNTFAVRLIPPTAGTATHAVIVDNTDSTFSAEYTTYTSGANMLHAGLLAVGGLTATYYDTISLTTPVGTRADATVDWSIAGPSTVVPFTGLTTDNAWSVRWAGMVKPCRDSVFTFYSVVNGVDERVQLWVDNSLIIEEWSSLSAFEVSGTVSLKSSFYYDIKMEYYANGNTDTQFGLKWQCSTDVVKGIIRSERLYQHYDIAGSPFLVTTASAGTCATQSTATGDGLSTATTGRQASFTITARDLYGNLRNTGGEVFRVRMQGADANSGIVTDTGAGTYTVVYTATVAGTYDIDVIYGASGIIDSPFRATVDPASRHISSSTVTSPGLTLATAGVTSTLYITIRDKHDNMQSQGGAVVASGLSLLFDDLTTTTNIATIPQASMMTQDTATGVTAVALFTYAVSVSGTYKLRLTAGSTDGYASIKNSPFDLTVVPNQACAAKTTSTGAGLSVATAGQAATFTLHSKDAWQNLRNTGGDTMVVGIRSGQGTGGTMIHGTVTDANVADYPVTYTPTKAGSNTLLANLAVAGGLTATYYAATGYITPLGTAVTATVDYSHGGGTVPPAFPAITDVDNMYVRWNGFVRPSRTTEAYTFFTEIHGNDKVRLWVDNSLLIDQWTVVTATLASGTMTFATSNSYYDIQMDWKHTIGVSQPYMHKLLWQNAPGTVPFAIIPSSRLYQAEPLQNSPFTVSVSPAVACATTSTPTGAALSIATAGTAARFTIQARDAYGNNRDTGGDDFEVSMLHYTTGKITYDAAVVYWQDMHSSAPGQYLVDYTAETAASYKWYQRLTNPGGLLAKYFENSDLTDRPSSPVVATYTRVDATVDFSWGAEMPVATSVSTGKTIGPDYFSVRWAGLVLPEFSETYTFQAAVDDGAKLWVNGLLIINAWGSTCSEVEGTIALVGGTKYDIKLDYREAIGNASISLKWKSKSTPLAVVPSNRLYYVTNLTITAENNAATPTGQIPLVRPAITCASLSVATGHGLSLATAGTSAAFTIQSKDRYGNLKTDASDVYSARLVPMVLYPRPYHQVTPLAAGSSGQYGRSYLPTIKGFYNVHATLAHTPNGLSATYYDDEDFGTPVSTRTDSLVDFTSWGNGPTDVSLSDGNSFTVRWAGFFQTAAHGTETYSFRVTFAGTDERARLWVDNSLIVDEWDTYVVASGTAVSGTLSVEGSTMYDIKLEYMEFSDDAKPQLWWARPGGPVAFTVVPSSMLFQHAEIMGSPFPPITVQPAATCGTLSTVVQASLATVGVSSTFTIQANDMYDNERGTGGDVFVARAQAHPSLACAGCPVSVPATVTDRSDSSYVAEYTTTVSGNYQLLTSLAVQGGLSATYYDASVFGGAMSTPLGYAAATNVDYSLASGGGAPFGVLAADAAWGARWAGFVRPSRSTEAYTFYAYVHGVDERVNLWVDNSLVISDWTSLSGTVLSGTMQFASANSYYDIKLDYQTNLGSTTDNVVQLKWQNSAGTASTSAALGIIRTDRLFKSVDVANTPITLVSAIGATCGSRSVATGDGLSVATAGTAATFKITAKDKYHNLRSTGGDNFLVRLAGPTVAHNVIPGTSVNGEYAVTYTTTEAGDYAVTLQSTMGGGLMASYYNNIWLLGDAVYSKVDETVDYSWGTSVISSYPAGTSVDTGSDYVSVRWAGYLKPDRTETLTFYTNTDDGVRLWVDNVKLVDQWDSTGQEFTGTFAATLNKMYDIKMEYKEVTGAAYAQLMWGSTSIPKAVIPSTRLHSSPVDICGSPFAAYVHASANCATTSTVSGAGLSYATTGVAAPFTIQAKDQYGNLRTVSDATFLVRANVGAGRSQMGSHSNNVVLGKYNAMYTPTVSGSATVHCAMPATSVAGLSATYYDDAALATPVATRSAQVVDYSSATNTDVPSTPLTTDNQFSVRWSGFVRPCRTDQYTFYVTLNNVDERVQLWVDNSLLINEWTSLSGTEPSATIAFATTNQYYDVRMDYAKTVTTTAAKSMSLKWQNAASSSVVKGAIRSERLFTPAEAVGAPYTITVMPGPVNWIATQLSGTALTLATAGVAATFSIQSKDVSTNNRVTGGAEILVHVTGTAGNTAVFNGAVTDASDGTYTVSYTPKVQGQYDLTAQYGVDTKVTSLTVQPGDTSAPVSVATGVSLSLATAGTAGTFTIQSKDTWANLRTVQGSLWAVRVTGPGTEFHNRPLTDGAAGSGQYTATYTTTQSGAFTLNVQGMRSNGLNAIYYRDTTLTNAVLTQTDEYVDFNWGVDTPHANVGSVDNFSVQWSGYVRPIYTDVYTWYTTISGTDERVRLWLDNSLVIDQWTSLLATEPTGTYSVLAETLYDVKLHYKEVQDAAQISLKWFAVGTGAGQSKAAIGSDRLYTTATHIAGSPFTVTVRPGETCGTVSTAAGTWLSIQTAGTAAAFTIQAKDALANDKTTASDLFAVHARLSGRDILGTVTSVAGNTGKYSGLYKPTQKGTNTVTAALAVPGGLWASYWNDNSGTSSTYFSTSVGSEVKATVDWSAGSNAVVPFTGVTADGQYNIRWAGYVRPSRVDQKYTFFTELSANDERVRLWVDNSIIIDQWSSLSGTVPSGVIQFAVANAFYDIKLEYWSGPTSTTRKTVLKWQNKHSTADLNLGYSTVVSSRLYQTAAIAGTTTVNVLPAVASASQCTNAGAALTLATAGVARTFSITAHDEFANERTQGDNHFTARATLMAGGSPTHGTVTYDGSNMGRYTAAYTINTAGSYHLGLSLADVQGTGLFGTYYQSTDFTNPFESRYDGVVNYNWGRNSPVTDTSFGTDNFTVRWTGLVRSAYTETYTFYTKTDDGVKLWVDNTLLVNQWAQSGTEFSGTIAMNKNTLYDIKMEYLELTGNAYADLSWKSQNQAKAIIATEYLYPVDQAIASSPHVLNVFPAAISATRSTMTGPGLTIATAGISTQFSIQSRDAYDNAKTWATETFGVRLLPSAMLGVKGTVTAAAGSGLYQAQYMITKSGTHSLYSSLATVGGLTATYYNGNDLTSAYGIGVAPTVDWSGTSTAVPLTGLTTDAAFSVRWSGFVFPSKATQTYTFYAGLFDADERVRLWVDNSIIIDQWTSLSGTTPTGTISFPAAGGNYDFYDVKLDYSTSSGSNRIQLYWQAEQVGSPVTKAIVPSTRLYQTAEFTGKPFSVPVKAAVVSATVSTEAGMGLTLATAGTAATFTIQSKDAFGNNRGTGGDTFVSRLHPVSGSCTSCPNIVRGTVTDVGDSTHTVTYTATKQGSYSLMNTLPVVGSLVASFYDDTALTPATVKGTGTSGPVDWSATSTTVPFVGLTTDNTYSIRWAGFVRPSRSDVQYTFYTTVQGADERVQLWVDNSLVIEQWTSLTGTDPSGTYLFPTANAYYDIKLEYAANNVGSQSLALKWQNADTTNSAQLAKSVIVSSRLYQSLDVAGSPSTVTLHAGTTCAAQSTAMGVQLSLATAGTAATFTIQAKDAYQNMRSLSDTNFDVVLHGSGGSPVYSGSIAAGAAGSGQYTATYTALKALNYEVFARVGLSNIKNSPFTDVVKPATLCTSKSTATGTGLTAATLSTVTTFTIQARDVYSNAKSVGGATFKARANLTPLRSVHSTISDTSDGKYSSQYTVTASSGTYNLHVGIPSVGGLTATYYQTTVGSTPAITKTDTTVNIAHAAAGVPDAAVTADNDYAVRWTGFVRPSATADQYTFYTEMSTNDERVRLWVDNSLIINQWTSLAGTAPSGTIQFALANDYYDVKLEYAVTASGTTASALALKWQSTPGTGPNYGLIASDRLYTEVQITGSPFTLSVT